MFIDSHAHLDMPQFEEDLPGVIQRAEQAGVRLIITVGTDLDSSHRAVKLAHLFPQVFAAVGIHPHNARDCTFEALARLREMATSPKVVAIGETGLDFYRNLSPPEAQILAFREQIRLAREIDKPVVVHDRDAHKELTRVLKEEGTKGMKGVIHCFSGDLAMAKQCFEMGLSISIPGSVTFRNAARLRNVVLNAPPDRILLETDAPFLAPIPFRGKRNEPSFIKYTADRVAKVRKVSLEELAAQVCDNTTRLFSLPGPCPSD
ncbi:MAG: TatD family hydrolase [Thermodesulfobacteriota bacterium]